MKTLSFVIISLLIGNYLIAQDKLEVPELSPEQKQEVLYNHVMSYAVSGISFAKSKDVSPEKYGNYVGKLFTPFWNPADGFPAFANGMMYILAGIHPNNEMTIVEQGKENVKFKLKNVDLVFQGGPFLGVSYTEMLDFSFGVISVLAEHMNLKFSYKITDNVWYEVAISAM